MVSGNSDDRYIETVRTKGLDLVTCLNKERFVHSGECATGHLFDVELGSTKGFLIVPRFEQFLIIRTSIKHTGLEPLKSITALFRNSMPFSMDVVVDDMSDACDEAQSRMN